MDDINNYIQDAGYGNSRILKSNLNKYLFDNQPKKPKNPYLIWLDKNLTLIKHELGGGKGIHKVSMKLAASRWKLLSLDEKKIYKDEFIKNKKLYD